MSTTLNPAVAATPAAQLNARAATRSILQAAGMLPVLILLALGFHFLGGHRFLSGQNLSIIAQQASINTVLASGMTFVILTGGIDLSVGSILAFAAMCGLIVSTMPHLAWLAVPACLGAGLLIGVFNGASSLVSRFRLSS